jgi:hypothetical protein
MAVIKYSADVTVESIAVQSFSSRSATNPLVAFYDIHGGKIEAINFFCPEHNTRYPHLYFYNLQKSQGLNHITVYIILRCHHHPINVPTTGAQAFLMDYT